MAEFYLTWLGFVSESLIPNITSWKTVSVSC